MHQVLSDVTRLLAKLPPEAIEAFGKLVAALLRSSDPGAAVKRVALGEAAKRALDEGL